MMSSARLVARLAAPLLALSFVAGAAADAGAMARIQRVVSPGGIEAWLVEEHTVPLVAVNFAFRGGSSQDPPGKEGLANVLSTLLDEGAGNLESEAFQKRMDELAVKLSFSESRDSFQGEMKTLLANREAGFDLLRLAISEPRFDPQALERMRTQAIAGLRRAARDPNTIAGELWSSTAFPGHPYGRPANGTEATVAGLTADDFRAYRSRVFARDGLKIAVVGAIDAATLAPLLDSTFGALAPRGDLRPVAEVTPDTARDRDETMAIPQTVVRFGGKGLKRADPDFIAAFVMNHILGGGSFSSRLYTEVREKRGLAYSVYTALAPLDHAGVFVGGVATRADRAAESLEVIRNEIRRMAEAGPTPDELKLAKDYLAGSYALRFDTSDKIAGQLLAIQMDDLGIDYIEKRNALVDAVGLEDVKRVARKILAEGLLVVTVGPARG